MIVKNINVNQKTCDISLSANEVFALLVSLGYAKHELGEQSFRVLALMDEEKAEILKQQLDSLIEKFPDDAIYE